eukprot:GEMP01012497.1.p1 GENE.GEMP01012497.1~~GEMP01012497.1.p1  ORF type:complete len:410 (+),score=77.55 GEMP01012497.1:253-1482(+)
MATAYQRAEQPGSPRAPITPHAPVSMRPHTACSGSSRTYRAHAYRSAEPINSRPTSALTFQTNYMRDYRALSGRCEGTNAETGLEVSCPQSPATGRVGQDSVTPSTLRPVSRMESNYTRSYPPSTTTPDRRRMTTYHGVIDVTTNNETRRSAERVVNRFCDAVQTRKVDAVTKKLQAFWRGKKVRLDAQRRRDQKMAEQVKQENVFVKEMPDSVFTYVFRDGGLRITRDTEQRDRVADSPPIIAPSKRRGTAPAWGLRQESPALPPSRKLRQSKGAHDHICDYSLMKTKLPRPEHHLGRVMTFDEMERTLQTKCREKFKRTHDAFRWVDREKEGTISLVEMKVLLGNLLLPHKYGEALLKKLDADNSGVVNYRDFQRYFGPVIQQGYSVYIENKADHSSIFGRGLRKLA